MLSPKKGRDAAGRPGAVVTAGSMADDIHPEGSGLPDEQNNFTVLTNTYTRVFQAEIPV